MIVWADGVDDVDDAADPGAPSPGLRSMQVGVPASGSALGTSSAAAPTGRLSLQADAEGVSPPSPRRP